VSSSARYSIVLFRTFIDHADPDDIEAANQLRDRLEIRQAEKGSASNLQQRRSFDRNACKYTHWGIAGIDSRYVPRRHRRRTMASQVLVVGGSFAGLNAAYALKRALKDNVDVTVVSRQPDFVFIPSLIWVLTGKRRAKQVTFAIEPKLAKKGIRFVKARVDAIDPVGQTLTTENGPMRYDYLILATGPKLEWDAIPGLGPDNGYTHSVCSLPHSIEANEAFEELLKDPGPVVIGATQGASCFGAAYEVVLNVDHALRKAGVRDKAPVMFLSSEPFAGHFGLGGLGKGEELIKKFFKSRDIEWIVNTGVDHVDADKIVLGDGREVPYKYSILIPPFLGVDAVTNSPELCNQRGFITVNDRYQSTQYPNIYAAGVDVAVAPPSPTEVPTGVPKTGYMAEVMGMIAARNIAADITGSDPEERKFGDIDAICILDAGNSGMILAIDHIFPPRKREWLIPGPWAHWAKLAFERYYLWKMKVGAVYLP
jgi:sulfide:quinone oxidoreductase